MKDNFVIFKNPYIRYREEVFGGIAKIILKTYILNKAQYSFIDKIDKVIVYGDLKEIEKKIAKKLIDEGLLLKVGLEKAKDLGFKDDFKKG